MKRRRLGHPQSGIFQCELCNFETGKHANFLRHLETDKHTRNASYVCGDGLRPPCPENDNDNELEATLPAVEESNHGEPIPYEDSGSESEVGHSYNEDSRIDFQVQQETCTWFPFSSKLEMLLYVMLHSKTHIMSDETAKFVWYIMKEAGINMPPFSLIKGMRFGELTPESLLQQGKGEDGSPFWFLKPSALVGLAVSHPETSNQLIRYGRFSSSPHRISEQADSKKWLQQIHAVSAKKRNGILYAGDFAIDVVTNQIGRITNFLQDYESNTIYAQLSMLESMGPNRLIITDQINHAELDCLDVVDVQQAEFYSYDEENVDLRILSATDKEQLFLSSPEKENKLPTYCIPVNMFLDDTSANKSKKWNALHCIQLQLAGLPVAVRQQSNNVKFVSASNEVSMMDMVAAVVKDLQDAKRQGVQTYDAKEKQEMVATTELAICVCDFSMMAEASNHMGANTKKFCPRCKVDRSSCIQKGDKRMPTETKRVLERLALNNNNKELKQQHGLKYYPNALWDIINPHRDIPVSMLHWMYLGIAKHLLKCCIHDLKKDELLVNLLESMDQSSFKEKMSSQVIGYIDSRQGKDIKHYIQIAPYHMMIAGLPHNKVNLLCRLAEICRYIEVQREYTEGDINHLNDLIESYLQTSTIIYPELLNKVKTHMSSHIADDILEHGPPSSYIEDAFEKMHGSIRQQIFSQNQHARSRDTAIAFAEQEVLKHVISGGYFRQEKKWTQASENVQEIAKDSMIQKYLGNSSTERKERGVCCKANRASNKKLIWTQTLGDGDPIVEVARRIYPCLSLEPASLATFTGVRCKNGDLVLTGNSLLYDNDNKESVGIFIAGYEVKGCPVNIVKLQVTSIEEEKEDDISQKYSVIPQYIHISSKNILQSVCLIHDCLGGGCHLREGHTTMRKEQQDVRVSKTWWHHNMNHKIYFLNKFRFTHLKTKY